MDKWYFRVEKRETKRVSFMAPTSQQRFVTDVAEKLLLHS